MTAPESPTPQAAGPAATPAQPRPARGRRRLWAALGGIAAVALAGAAVFLAAGGGDGPAAGPSASPSPPASPAPAPAPSSTLPADQQQAVEEAAAAVLAYEQVLVDLYAADAPYLNDLSTVAVDPQLSIDLDALTEFVGAGTGTVDPAGAVTLGEAAPVELDLDGDPAALVLDVCVDQTAVTGTTDGSPWTGQRQESRYRVVQTGGGWAVAQVLPPAGFDQPQPC